VNEAIQRLLPAALLTLALHGGLLSLRLHQPEAHPPEPPVQRISVSLKRLPPPPQKKIIQHQLPPLPELAVTEHKPLSMLPAPPVLPTVRPKTGKKAVARTVRKPTVKPAPRKKTAVPAPVLQKILTKQPPPLPKIISVVREVLSPLPPPEPTRKEVATQSHVQKTEQSYLEIPWETVSISPPSATPRSNRQPAPSRATAVQNRHLLVTNRAVSTASNKQPTPPRSTELVREATPLYQSNPPPKYPRMARRRGLEGVVTIEALIDSNGKVVELRIFSSSGHRILNKSAMKAVRGWRFTPGTVGGRRQQMRVKVPVRFQLR
jgi:protein TonB